jgi:hypothetical protein
VITVCVAEEGVEPRKWHSCDIRVDQPGWDELLLGMVRSGRPGLRGEAGEGPVAVALEPTGGHYSAPIVHCLATRADVALLYVNHGHTRHVRETFVSGQKTDRHDAQALAVCALDLERNGLVPRGCQLNAHLSPGAEPTAALRLALNSRARATRESVRIRNCLRAYAHGIWPALDVQFGTYLNALCLPEAAITPQQLAALALELDAQHPARGHPFHATRSRYLLRELVAALANAPEPGAALVEAMRVQAQQYAASQALVAAADASLERLVDDAQIRGLTALWRTVPCASTCAIAALHAATYCRAAEFTPDQFRAAVGCRPQRQESGTSQDACQPRSGYRLATSSLHLWTLLLLNPVATPPNAVRTYFQALKEAGKRHCLASARGKLARMLCGIARTGTPYRGEDEAH